MCNCDKNVLNIMSSPLRLGPVEIKNHFIVSPMVMNCCNEDGTVTEKWIAYHEEKAKGGWGLIVTEDCAVDPTGRTYEYIPGLWADYQIESHKALTDRIHAAGAKIFAQIFHGGRQTQEWITGEQVWAPSPIPCPVKKAMPHEMTTQEVEEMVEKFGDAALRAKKAGYDGIQIHGGHGYLITEFASSYSNKRTDKYGGNMINRMRFPMEIVQNIKAKCGDDFPIDYKISGEERVEGGTNIEDTKAMAMLLESAGITSLNVSVGVYESWFMQVPPSVMGHGWLTKYSSEIKKVVDIPVTTVGRINNPLVAEAIIKSGKADACYMGRASLADPHMPNKAMAGQFEDIIQCIACLQGCSGQIDAVPAQHGGCTLNPRTVMEDEWKIEEAEVKKNVMVIGAGPAGCEAAIVLAERGHKVTVVEKEPYIGGLYRVASIPPWKGEIIDFIRWQQHQMEKLGVEVKLNTEATKEMIEAAKPDAVVVATGYHPFVPPFPGKDREFVVGANDVLMGKEDVNGKIAVIGGGLVGAETANHLATHDNEVTIIEMLPKVAGEEPGSMRKFLMESFEEHGVDIHVSTAVQTINEDKTITVKAGEEMIDLGPFDAVVTAVGLHPNTELKDVLEETVPEVLYAGGALNRGNALNAIREGYKAGLEI